MFFKETAIPSKRPDLFTSPNIDGTFSINKRYPGGHYGMSHGHTEAEAEKMVNKQNIHSKNAVPPKKITRKTDNLQLLHKQHFNESLKKFVPTFRNKLYKGKVHTGVHAENHFIKAMSGSISTDKGAGSKGADISISHPDAGVLSIDMKAGRNTDFSQQRVEVGSGGTWIPTKGSTPLDHTLSPNASKRVSRLLQRHKEEYESRSGGEKMPEGSVTKTRNRRTGGTKTFNSPKVKTSLKSVFGPATRIGLSHKNLSDFIPDKDHFHVHVHPKTGDAIIVPTRKDHHKYSKHLGIPNIMSYHDLAKHPEFKNENSSSKLRSPRAKEQSMNISTQLNSGHIVDAHEKAGSTVFKSTENNSGTEHLVSHLMQNGWSIHE